MSVFWDAAKIAPDDFPGYFSRSRNCPGAVHETTRKKRGQTEAKTLGNRQAGPEGRSCDGQFSPACPDQQLQRSGVSEARLLRRQALRLQGLWAGGSLDGLSAEMVVRGHERRGVYRGPSLPLVPPARTRAAVGGEAGASGGSCCEPEEKGCGKRDMFPKLSSSHVKLAWMLAGLAAIGSLVWQFGSAGFYDLPYMTRLLHASQTRETVDSIYLVPEDIKEAFFESFRLKGAVGNFTSEELALLLRSSEEGSRRIADRLDTWCGGCGGGRHFLQAGRTDTGWWIFYEQGGFIDDGSAHLAMVEGKDDTARVIANRRVPRH